MFENAYLQNFMEIQGFPSESREPLRDAFAKLAGEKASPEIAAAEDALFGGKSWDGIVAPALSAVSERIGVHRYTVELLFLIAESERLRENYLAAGLSEAAFLNTAADLLYKMRECHEVYGVWGTFVGSWFPWFYTLKRFALGRLQFEKISFDWTEPVSVGGCEVRPGDTVYNIHIPSAGPLTEESCIDAYRRAYDFYKTTDGERLTFVCGSWLLFPGYREVFPAGSNIRRFSEDFYIYASVPNNFYDRWRVFGKDHKKPDADLPEDTSLRRAFKRHILAGGDFGAGKGVFFYDGKEFVK